MSNYLSLVPLPTPRRFSWYPHQLHLGGDRWRPTRWYELPPADRLEDGELCWPKGERLFDTREATLATVARKNLRAMAKIPADVNDAAELEWLIPFEIGTRDDEQICHFEWTHYEGGKLCILDMVFLVVEPTEREIARYGRLPKRRKAVRS